MQHDEVPGKFGYFVSENRKHTFKISVKISAATQNAIRQFNNVIDITSFVLIIGIAVCYAVGVYLILLLKKKENGKEQA